MDPSGGGVILALVAIVIPFAWPLLLYMLLRYLTGHRAPGSSGFLASSLGQWMHYPSGIGVIASWVIAVCTLAYPLAFYMTWRYATGHRVDGRTQTSAVEVAGEHWAH